MKNASLLIILFYVLIASCGRKSQPTTTISWQGAGGIEGASWSIDETHAGKGVEGYKAVLKHLDAQPDHSLVWIQYSFLDWNETTEGYDPNDSLPFKGRNDLRTEFSKVIQRKDLGVRIHALHTDPRANQNN